MVIAATLMLHFLGSSRLRDDDARVTATQESHQSRISSSVDPSLTSVESAMYGENRVLCICRCQKIEDVSTNARSVAIAHNLDGLLRKNKC